MLLKNSFLEVSEWFSVSVNAFGTICSECNFNGFDLGDGKACSADDYVVFVVVDGKCSFFRAGDCFHESVVVDPKP